MFEKILSIISLVDVRKYSRHFLLDSDEGVLPGLHICVPDLVDLTQVSRGRAVPHSLLEGEEGAVCLPLEEGTVVPSLTLTQYGLCLDNSRWNGQQLL